MWKVKKKREKYYEQKERKKERSKCFDEVYEVYAWWWI